LILNTDYSGHSVLYKVEIIFNSLVSMFILKLETVTYYKVLYIMNAFVSFSTINNDRQLIPYILVWDTTII